MEKIKKLENGEEVVDEISNSYYETVLTNGKEEEKRKEKVDYYDKKIKKKKKKTVTKSFKGENDENDEDIKEKRW